MANDREQNVELAKPDVAAQAPEVPGYMTDQQKVLEVIRAGKGIAEAARTVGLCRQTIYRWIKDDAQFRAVYHQWKEEMEESAHSRLLAILDTAVETVKKGMEAGNTKAAMALIDRMGVCGGPTRRLTDAKELEKQDRLAARRRKYELDEEDRKLRADEMICAGSRAQLSMIEFEAEMKEMDRRVAAGLPIEEDDAAVEGSAQRKAPRKRGR
jgi:Helix-turn-helix domain